MRAVSNIVSTFLAGALVAQAAKFGDRSCTSASAGANICVSAVYDDAALTVDYQAVYTGSTPGWIGVGQGEQMAGANMMVAWPFNGEVVLSQRTTGSHAPPTSQAITAKAFVPNASASSTNASATVLSWTFPVDADFASSKTAHIWAYSPVSPSSASAGAPLMRHSNRGFINFDLTKPVEAATGQPAATGNGPSTSSSSAEEEGPKIRDLSLKPVRIFLAHVIIMSIAWMGLVPAGILVGRFGRTYLPDSWFRIHRAIQITALVLIIVGFALGVQGVQEAGGPHFVNSHEKLGLAMFILVLLQAFGGQIGHLLNRGKNFRGLNLGHIVLGVVLFFGLSLWQIRMGLDLWLWRPSKAVGDIFFPVWFGIITAVFLLGLVLVPRQRKQEQADNEKASLGTGPPSP